MLGSQIVWINIYNSILIRSAISTEIDKNNNISGSLTVGN